MTYAEECLEMAYTWLYDAKWWLEYGSDKNRIKQAEFCIRVCEERIKWLLKELKK